MKKENKIVCSHCSKELTHDEFIVNYQDWFFTATQGTFCPECVKAKAEYLTGIKKCK